MPTHTFKLNGKQVSVDIDGSVRLLWVLRDVLGVTGPKYGCGLGVCQACTSHINGRAFNPCAVPVSQIKPTDEITTIEGLPATAGRDLHPMQEAWLRHDVSQCGYCQPGQIMTAVAKVRQAREAGHDITDADLDELRNVCRCGTYSRVREAIKDGAAEMGDADTAAPRTTRSPSPSTTPAPTSPEEKGKDAVEDLVGKDSPLRPRNW